MKKQFNATHRKEMLLGPVGIKFDLSADFAETREERGLWGHSSSFVTNAVCCILVGMSPQSDALLLKAKEWMECAMRIDEKARMFEETSRKFHLELYSLIRWLVEGYHDQGCLDLWLVEADKYFTAHPERLKTADVGLQAVTFLDAGAFEPYLRWAGTTDPQTVKLSRTSEKTMAAAMASQALTQKFKPELLHESVMRFLDANVGTWLSNGLSQRAAHWMKVVYWKNGTTGLTPAQAVLKCLDHVEIVA